MRIRRKNIIFFFLLLVSSISKNASNNNNDNFNVIFAPKTHANHYWEALIQMAHNNKDAAQKIVHALKSGEPLDTLSSWHDEQPENIDAFFDQLFIHYIAHSPQWITQMGLFEAVGVKEHNAHLDDVSPEAIKRRHALKKISFDILNRYDFKALTQEQKLSHKVFHWMLNHQSKGEQFIFHQYFVNQMEGLLAELSILFTQFHKLEDLQDFHHYIQRLKAIPAQIKQAIELFEHQKNIGVIPPQFTVQKIISIIERSNVKNVKDHFFYKTFAQEIKKLKSDTQDALLTQAEEIIQNEVSPAYDELKQYFIALLNDARNNHGVWSLPDGDEYYKHMIRYHTSVDISPERIYELGLSEVATIQKEMRSILAQEGIVDEQKEVGVLLEELSKDPKFYYANDDEGRAQCLADYHLILERIRKELVHLFDLKPQTGVKIQRVPEHEQEGAPMAYYYQPSVDGSRPGIFFANLRNMNEIPKFGMETLTVHEAEPGHHFQLALQNEMNIPILRKISSDFTAFYEGWALYTEKLAYEEGFYSSSFAKLGHLQDELLRAARLVIDTGIHHRRWTREQAIEYMVRVTGYHYDSAVTEIERYFVLPGQACSYKIGQLKILELRKKAKDLLGDKFDIREFHNVVLKHGAVPLMVLEELVNEYIESINVQKQ